MSIFADGWAQLEAGLRLRQYDFERAPLHLDAARIKALTNNKEPRILCSQDSREGRPLVFQELGLFMLPVRNGAWVILRGEGYVDLPPLRDQTSPYRSQLDFELQASRVGDSEMQYLDFAYATSLIRSFMRDSSLVLTIRGRKRTPAFSFRVGMHELEVQGVQTEVDAGYEGREQIVLVEAKNRRTSNFIIRQLYYPYRQWSTNTGKPVKLLHFVSLKNSIALWQYAFDDPHDYNSIRPERQGRYHILESSGDA